MDRNVEPSIANGPACSIDLTVPHDLLRDAKELSARTGVLVGWAIPRPPPEEVSAVPVHEPQHREHWVVV